jgi:hypothetical protein
MLPQVCEWHVGTCLAVPRGERELETSLLAPAPLLPLWEKGLGDEGKPQIARKSTPRPYSFRQSESGQRYRQG